MRNLLLSALALMLANAALAQTATTGIPYFQQQVHYDLTATMVDDMSAPALEGTGTLTYTNNAPDTLHELYFHLYWNLFRSGSYGESAPNRDHDPDSRYGHAGIDVHEMSVVYPNAAGSAEPHAQFEVDNTILRLRLSHPLAPGAIVRVSYTWTGIMPDYQIRSTWGWHDGAARNFSTAQWYPQVCVYDAHGWHPDQYIGMGEFYTDYGEFDVTLKLPDYFATVVSTGRQTNPEATLSPSELAQLAFAREHPDSIVRVADHSAFMPHKITKTAPLKTWTFHADSVRDFAWCADEAYIWDAVYDNGIMHSALYWNNSRAFWSQEAAKVELLTIQTNSKYAGQYVYPNIFMCETYEGGMEYPGIVFIGPYQSGHPHHYSQNTMMHELGHEWYPMMMGSNETDYGYMDEGFNTFITTLVHEKYFGRHDNAVDPGLGYTDDERQANYRAAWAQQVSGDQEPSKQKADVFFSYHDYAEATYPHTSSVFVMLRYTMGDDAFERFMQLYYQRWHFKHPYPDDLLNTAEDVERRFGDTSRVRAHGDLRWFFNQWFEQTWKLDYAVGSFSVDQDAAGSYRASVQVLRKERAVMPLDLVFTFDDGSTEQRWIAVDDWLRTVASERSYSYTFTKRPVSVEINPSMELLDVNRLNNTSGLLPRTEISLVPKVLGDSKPVDAYAVRSGPCLAPLDAGFSTGWLFGWRFLGSYLDRSDRIAIAPHLLDQHGSNLAVTGSVHYHSVFDLFSPTSDIDVLLAHTMPGHEFYGFRYSHIVREQGSDVPQHIIESGFDLSGPVWGGSGAVPPLDRAYAGYTMRMDGDGNAFTLAGQVEEGLGDPRTTYTKIAATVNDRLEISDNWNAYLRLFGGSMQPIGSAMPAGTSFQLSSPSDIDHMSDLYGSNFGTGLRDKIRNAAVSGPMVRGYIGRLNTEGRVAGSATFELGNRSLLPFNVLRMIPYIGRLFDVFGFVAFADAGLVTDAFCTCNYRSEVRSDAGVGLRFLGFDRSLGRTLGIDPERTEFQLDFPIYLDHPAGTDPHLKFRAVGLIRQNF